MSEYSSLVRDASLWGCWQSVRIVRSPTFSEPPPGPRPYPVICRVFPMTRVRDETVCVSGEIFDVILGDVDVIKMTLMLWCHITLETEILTTLPCHVRAKIFSFEWIATLQWNVEAIQLISLQTELTAERKHCYPRDNHFFVQCWDAICFNKDFQECSS